MNLLVMLLVSCSGEGTGDPTKDYCPISSFDEQVTSLYCTKATACGAFQSYDVCMSTASIELDCTVYCEDSPTNPTGPCGMELVFDPTDAERCLSAISEYMDDPELCPTSYGYATGMTLLANYRTDADGNRYGPGIEGCGWVEEDPTTAPYDRALCVEASQATAVCEE